MRNYSLKLEKYGIDRQRYEELHAICRQYDKYRRLDAKMHQGEYDQPTKGNGHWSQPDPTGNRAVMLAGNRYAQRVKAIEAAAKAASPALAWHIIQNVARGKTYEQLMPPCGQRQWTEAKRRFFAELDALV